MLLRDSVWTFVKQPKRERILIVAQFPFHFKN